MISSEGASSIPTASSRLTPLSRAMMAGACAGAFEHVCTFPFDTVKTSMQVSSKGQAVSYSNLSTSVAFRRIVQKEGIRRLYRGLSVVVAAAIPSHALYFGMYEFSRSSFQALHPQSKISGTEIFLSGGMATVAHDFVVTPLDVVKQRMQMPQSSHTKVLRCVADIYRKEGLSIFYRSYPTTLLLNIPFQGAYFLTYETVKSFLCRHMERESGPIWLASGFSAGAFAGLVSTPLDVAKTFIQTTPQNTDLNPARIVSHIARTEGVRSLLKGAGPRVMICAPASSICWFTYESMKRVLGWQLDDEYLLVD
eukprot:218991_1